MLKIFDESEFRIFGSIDHYPSNAARKLAEFKNLPEGWNYGCGVPIRNDVFERATILQEHIEELLISKTDAFPGSDGDVCITAYHFSHYLEVTVEVDLTVSVSYEVDDIEISSKEELSLVEAKKELRRAVEKIWASSDLFTRAITMQPETDSITWRLRNPQMEPAPPLSVWSVLTALEGPFVTMSGDITPEYRGSPLSIGNSMKLFYRTDTG